METILRSLRQRHTPMRSLQDPDNGNFIGYQCEHCDTIFTPGGYPSQVNKITLKGEVENKAHSARVRAANA